MAFDNNQQEPTLPNDNEKYIRKSENFLPKYFRTEYNKKFLDATLDQFIQNGTVEKLNGYFGRKDAKNYSVNDNYINIGSDNRNNYQLEPITLITDDLDNVEFYADYNDYLNHLKINGVNTLQQNIINQTEYYSWDPHINWDKFVNYREYYWLPNGPETVTVIGQTKDIESTYQINLASNDDNVTYVFTPNGITNNPSITLYRGQKYRFEINVPNYPIAFATKKSFTPGTPVLIEAFDGIRAPGIFDINLYDVDGSAYDAGGFVVPPNEASFTIGESYNSSLIYKTGVSYLDNDGNEISDVYLEQGIIEFTVPDEAPDALYYISQNDPNVAGLIKIFDIIEATAIDVEKEILGKKDYKTSSGFYLTNGMKVKFAGNVFPEEYDSNEFFVEGVGNSIKLIKQNDLQTSGIFTANLEIGFDDQGFDFTPFSEAIGFPLTKDYIVINRASQDGNLWSRYNRWFHIDVIEKSFEITGSENNLDQAYRAKRPIIEFDAGIKLFNFGTEIKNNVDLIDFVTTDAFSKVEGSLGYNIDGIDLTEDMRVLFAVDTDTFVKGRIFRVKFVTINNATFLHLAEEPDSVPQVNENVFVENGNVNAGNYFYYTGLEWKLAQQKISVNQPPLFDLFDKDDVALSDNSVYESSQFSGNKLFSYVVGEGTNDSELNFPLTYQNIQNIGDIVFKFDLLNDSFTYANINTLVTKSTETAFLRIYDQRDRYKLVNGWVKGRDLSSQYAVRQYIADGNTAEFIIDMFDSLDINRSKFVVYQNNVILKQNLNYEIYVNNNGRNILKFNKLPTVDSIIVLKVRTTSTKNQNGYYEIPHNLERNPSNEDVTTFTLGEVNDHVSTIVEDIKEFIGVFPGRNNLRDLGSISYYGKRFIKHAMPINLPLFHLLGNNNISQALRYSMIEYSKFKRIFLEVAESLGFEGPIAIHLDKILIDLNKEKTITSPFYKNDMLGYIGKTQNVFTVEAEDESFYPLTITFDINNISQQAVYVYHNDIQLIHNKDYTFSNEGFVIVTTSKTVGDIIEIHEYEKTTGSYIPNTPTKLGLYPKFEPAVYIDDNAIYDVPVLHDKGYKVYGVGTFSGTQNYNLGWYYPLFLNKEDAINYDTLNGGDGSFDYVKFQGLNKNFFVSKNYNSKAANDTDLYDEWYENISYIQGHDGSKTVAYKDYRDLLLLELEKRIFNNIKIRYDKETIDINSFTDGAYRKVGNTKSNIDNLLFKDFLNYSKLIRTPYSINNYYDSTNSWTFNYSKSILKNNEIAIGWWRQLYRYLYDTDRPHTHPWEMLGFSIKPKWWNEEYGEGPYTKNNTPLWKDIENGVIRKPFYQVDKNYIRPGLTEHLPVDSAGNLLSPNDSGVVKELVTFSLTQTFEFGAGGPVENAWRNSSEYPFSLINAFLLLQPSKFFSIAYDRLRQKRNIVNQIIYSPTDKFIELKNIVDTEQTEFFSGLVNYIIDYKFFNKTNVLDTYFNKLKVLENRLGFKIGGFTDKEKFRLILDSRTPLNEGNVFVPEENYKLHLTTSHPLTEISYSGLIIEKQEAGFYVYGYDILNPYFNYFPVIKLSKDPVSNVGGVSVPYVTYEEGNFYQAATIVKKDNSFYQVVADTNTASSNNLDNFVLLDSLPVKGGIEYNLRTEYGKVVERIPYGQFFATRQDVIDFIFGYGKYLESLGFDFYQFSKQEYELLNWDLMIRKFVFWMTQNWDAGTLLSLSPAADKIVCKLPASDVQEFFIDKQSYNFLNVNFQPISKESITIEKTLDDVSITTKNTTDGLYFVKLVSIVKEHAVILDNKTVFNDIIYDKSAGYRQDRIKVAGYRVSGWKGKLFIPGFLYDEAKVTVWQQYQDYNIGDIIKYKEFFYIAMSKIVGSEFFNSDNWSILDERPEPSLIPNFDYRINQFADFYDLDSDNFDNGQQKLAQHLIGYQKRQYLENIINDDVSQYKFYQGFIKEKGTKNALNKLFDALASAEKDSLEFYEEWAVKDGQYGGSGAFDEIEIILDENEFKLSPQPILLTNDNPRNNTDLVYRIPNYEVFLKPKNYNNAPFPSKYVLETFVKNAGYVNPEDVQYTLGTYDDLTTLDITQTQFNNYVWIGNVERDWSVYQYVSNYIWNIEGAVTLTGRQFALTVSHIVDKDIVPGQVIGILNFSKSSVAEDDSTQTTIYNSIPVNGFFKVIDVVLNKITIELTDEEIIGLSNVTVDYANGTKGTISVFDVVRSSNLIEANKVAQRNNFLGNKLWIDDVGDKKWSVLQKQGTFNDPIVVTNHEYNTQYFEFLTVDDFSYTVNFDAETFVTCSVYYDIQNVLLSEKLIQSITDKTGTIQVSNFSGNIIIKFITSAKYFNFNVITSDPAALQFNSYYFEVTGGEDDYEATNVEYNRNYRVNSINQFGNVVAVDQRNTFMAVGVPNDGQGKVYMYSRTGDNVPWQLLEVLEPFPETSEKKQKFGASLSFTDDANFLLVGAPYASKVTTRYQGTFDGVTDYYLGDIVEYKDLYWEAKNDVLGSTNSIIFNSFINYNTVIERLFLDTERANYTSFVLAGNYPFANTNTNHFLIRVTNSFYNGIGEGYKIKLKWNELTNANQTQIELSNRKIFENSIPYLSTSYISNWHTVTKKIDVILYVDIYTTLPNTGELVTAIGATANVAYIYSREGSCTIYCSNLNGTFQETDTLFLNGLDFVGEMEVVGFIDNIDESEELAGFLLIETEQFYNVQEITSDSGRGLTVVDVSETDDLQTNRFYYNILDYETNDVFSESTDHSLIRILSQQGNPGPGGSTDIIYSRFYVVRAPEELTRSLVAGDEVSMYFNTLKNTVHTLFLNKPVTVQAGELLIQDNTGARVTVYENAVNSSEIKCQTVLGQFNLSDFISGSITGPLLARVLAQPIVDFIVTPEKINMTYGMTNRTDDIIDVWDGYIRYRNIFFQDGQPFEPIARYRFAEVLGFIYDFGEGQRVIDKTTGAIAEVMFYQRNLNDVTIFVKNVTSGQGGGFRAGEEYRQNTQINMLPFAQGPDIDAFGRQGIYDVERPLGQIQAISLQYLPAGIGKLIVFDSLTNLEPIQDGDDFLKGEEYWLYRENEVAGIPREALPPSQFNLDWTQIYKIPIDRGGPSSNFINEGAVYVYQRLGFNFIVRTGMVSPQRKSHHYFGSKIEITKANDDLYRGFVSASESTLHSYNGVTEVDATLPVFIPKNGIQVYRTVTDVDPPAFDIINSIRVRAYLEGELIFEINGLKEVDAYFGTRVQVANDFTTELLENALKYRGFTIEKNGRTRRFFANELKGNYNYFSQMVGSTYFTDSWYDLREDEWGKVYFIKNGTENGNFYNWDLAKNKKFRGQFEGSNGYLEGDIIYLGNEIGQLYTALTNTISGTSFIPSQWQSTDDLVDYVGYIPNDTSFKVLDDSALDSSLPNKENLHEFATEFTVSNTGEVVAVTVLYYNEPNKIAIYRNDNGFYAWSENIVAPNLYDEFGETLALSDDGTYLIVGSPNDDTVKNDQGQVFIYKLRNRQYELIQTLNSPQNELGERFGTKVKISDNILAVYSKNAESYDKCEFDNGLTTFDNHITRFSTAGQEGYDKDGNFFRYNIENVGTIYVYELVFDYFLFADALRYETGFDPVYSFGEFFDVKNRHIYVGLPKVKSEEEFTGTVLDFKTNNATLYNEIRKVKNVVDVEKIKKAFIYNNKTKQVIRNLDVLDPLQGKIAGPADENISFKTYYDPAVYSVGNRNTNTVVNQALAWTDDHVGEVWWNLTNAKFYYPNQQDVLYSANTWNKIFPSNTIDLYEWVRSKVLPEEWDRLSSTDVGVAAGYTGKSLYQNNYYSSKKEYDTALQVFTTYYYFWVYDKTNIPDVEGRSLSTIAIKNLIENPGGNGYQFLGLFTDNSLAVFNCENFLENKDVILNIQYYQVDNTNLNVHNQYSIITHGLDTSKPTSDMEQKWIDSLIGYDKYGRILPDPTLSEKQKYGNLNNPRQSLFVNRIEALKQYIEHVNEVLSKNLIVDNKNINNLYLKEEYPNQVERLYDRTVELYSELDFIGVAKAEQAEVQLVIENGTIVNTFVINPGKGYLVEPTYVISGKGSDLDLSFRLNDEGSIEQVIINNGGKNYNNDTVITIRMFSVLVTNDTTISGKWAIYERNSKTRQWNRTRSQAYNTELYWEFADWYAEGYSQNATVDKIIDYTYEIPITDVQIGEILKVRYSGGSEWLLLKKKNNVQTLDYTVNYDTVGRQNGTIRFKESIYDATSSLTSFDVISFDTIFFDNIPTIEIRNIANVIKDNLFIEELLPEYNKLFFASVRYVLAEQKNVDWVFKTSFIKAKHNVGELRQDKTFKNDNLSSFEAYINEVKPFKTKIREYISAYENNERNNVGVADFDLSPIVNYTSNTIQPIKTTHTGNELIVPNLTYPNKNWLDYVGFRVVAVNVADAGANYQNAPKLYLESQNGKNAEVVAEVGANGGIVSVNVVKKGTGYISVPKIVQQGIFEEDNFITPARFSVVLGESLVRSIKTGIKFDRISSTYTFASLDNVERFIGSGSKYRFNLQWPIDLQTSSTEIKIDNLVVLKSSYTVTNIVDNSKNYTRYFGQIELLDPPTANSEIIITYKKSINLLHAADRINLAYNPSTGQFGKELSQLMDGIDYGGVEVKSFNLDSQNGWDSGPWFATPYDTYDVTFEDVTFYTDGSTTLLELPNPFENGVIYNVYKNGIRIDDPYYGIDSELVKNPNALMTSITGDGQTNILFLQNNGIYTEDNDQIVVRKSTSDGSFIPTNIEIDSELSGGSLTYANAKGIAADDIIIDGDGFYTPLNSKGPEEFLPGTVVDTLDITVYERPTQGSSIITTRNHIVNDINIKSYDIGIIPVSTKAVFVKINNELQQLDIDYTISGSSVIFNKDLILNSSINISDIGYSGAEILDLDVIESNGVDPFIITNVQYTTNEITAFVTVNSTEIEVVLQQSTVDDGIPGNVKIVLPQAFIAGTVITYGLFLGNTIKNTQVTIEEFVADGINKTFDVTLPPFEQEPVDWFVVVKLNDKILNAGYNEEFVLTDVKEYQLKVYQVPLASLYGYQLRVFLNNVELELGQAYTFSAATSFDPTLDPDQQDGSIVVLNADVGAPGDILKVFVNATIEDVEFGGDYRFGYFDNNQYVSTPNKLHIYADLNANDKITLIHFGNHDYQDFDRYRFDVTQRTLLSPGVLEGSSEYQLDGSTATIQLTHELTLNRYYAIYLNSVRIDDPFFGNSSKQLNPNAIIETVIGNGGSVLNLNDLGIAIDAGDVLAISPVDAEYILDDRVNDWYEYRRMLNGYVPLKNKVLDEQYLWVFKNGEMLSSSNDYYLTSNKNNIRILKGLDENDTVEILAFGPKQLKNKYGWRIFKDVLNKTNYKILDGEQNIILNEDLHWYDNSIKLKNANTLPVPDVNTKNPGIIFIDKERIEYFVKDGNILKQLRRGTLGTGIPKVHKAGIEIYDQSGSKNIPYKDETITTIFTADGINNSYQLDFTASSVNEFEVFVAGRRLRKNEINSYQFDTITSQDSPEGDIVLPAEFELENSSTLVLLTTPLINQKVIVVRRYGKIWNDIGKSLTDSDNNIAVYLQGNKVDLPR